MKSNFESSIELLLRLEGLYSNRKADRGGPTNLGITLMTLKAQKDGDLNKDGIINQADVKLITPEYAKDIYRREYWNAVGADSLIAPIDYAAFDFAVNSGPGRAKAYLSQCNDNWITLMVYRKNFIDVIVSKDYTQQANYRGWLNRIARIVAWFSPSEGVYNEHINTIFSAAQTTRDVKGFEGWKR